MRPSGELPRNLTKTLVLGILLLLGAASRAPAGVASAEELIDEFKGTDRSRKRSPEELEATYLKILGALGPKMGAGDWGRGGRERQTFQRICWLAARPGAEAERVALCRATAKKILSGAPHVARVWMIRQLERIGRDDVVVPLARLLEDENAEIRECARRALENNPSPRATRALCGALYRAEAPEWRAALVDAIGFREDRAALGALAEQARSDDEEVRAAAAAALASTGEEAAGPLIARAMTTGSERARRVAADSCLLLADKLSEKGANEAALKIYRRFLGREGRESHLKCAAIIGLGRAGGADELTVILEALEDEDPEVRGAGVIALEMTPLENLKAAVRDSLERGGPPKRKAGLLRALAWRADASTLSIFTAVAADPDEAVRIVALGALEKVGDASTVPLLAKAATTGSDEERSRARRSLERIGDPGADRAILDLMRGLTKRAEAPMRAELIRSLAARGAASAVPELVKATQDADASVRKESYRALSALARADALPDLVRLLVGAEGPGDRREAEKAVVAACRRAGLVRTEARERAGRPVLSALRGAWSGQDKTGQYIAPARSLLYVLGKIGGKLALTAVREALRHRNPEIREAALRALADWPDVSPAEDLLRLARSEPEERHRVLALRGYVRVVGLPSDRPAEETLKMYGEGLRAARRPEDKRLVLAGMGEVKHLAALRALRSYMRDRDLASEAAAATVKVALSVSREHREEAKAALREVAGACEVEKIRHSAREAIDQIERYEGHIQTWLLAGPYSRKGKKDKDLFDITFPPEEPRALGAEDIRWRLVRAGGGPHDPWLVEMDKILRGKNRVCYLLAEVFSPAAQGARLELGTDDGVKAWLGGELVHANNASRGAAPGQDKVEVSLRRGWNRLMLKVTQGGGQWAACARFRSAEGSALEGLKTRVDREIFRGHIAEWQLAGPYMQDGENVTALFDIPFPPEQSGAPGRRMAPVEWRAAAAGTNPDRPYIVEMDRILGGDERVCYLRVQVFSPRRQRARMELGSDDGVKAWLNDRPVHANNAVRAVGIAQDKVEVTLRRGWNRLVLKVTQGGGQWSACVRFRSAEGSALEGIETRTEGW